MAIVLAAFSALTYGCADFIGGVAARRTPVSAVVLWSQGVGILVALIAAPFVGGPGPSLEGWLWGMAAGLSGAAGLGFLYKGLASGFASVVSPSAAIVGAALPVLFGFISGERPGQLTWIGVALAIPASLLLSTAPGGAGRSALRSLRMGLIAGAGFGGFFIFITRTGSEGGLWPLVAARTASVPVFFVISALRRRSLVLVRGSRAAVIGAGLLDMAANVFYLSAARAGMLITATVITALYPAPTVLLQRIAFGEKLNAARVCGLVLAIAGVALIGAD